MPKTGGRSATPEDPYRGLEATAREALRDLLSTGVAWIDDDGTRNARSRVQTLRDTLARRVPFPVNVTKERDLTDGQLGFVLYAWEK